MMDLSGRTALVVGLGGAATKTVGAALASAGASVATVRLPFAASAGGQATYLPEAVDSVAAQDVVKQAAAEHGEIALLVNTAIADALELEKDDGDRVVTDYLHALFAFTKALARPMLKQGYGRIVNVTSTIGIIGDGDRVALSAAAGGVTAFTKSVAREFGAKNVTANTVAVGFIGEQDVPESVMSEISLGRVGTWEEVAQVVVFLVSDAASYVSGQTVIVDGGMVME